MSVEVTWQSTAGRKVCVSLRQSEARDECSILQIPVRDVDIEGLGPAWAEGAASYDVAELPCRHVFHACALALHFATNDMRCPVCRQGCEAAVDVSTVSSAMRQALTSKAGLVEAQNPVEDGDFSLQLDVGDMIRDLTLRVEIVWVNFGSLSTRTFLHTPLRLDPYEHGQDTRQQYTTHRSFQRIFNANVQRAQTHDAEFRFSLLHPLLPYTLRSGMFEGAAMGRYMRDADFISLSDDVGAIHVSQTAEGRHVLNLHVNTQFLLMMCVQNVMRQYEHLIAT
jgi:hypothetical protein